MQVREVSSEQLALWEYYALMALAAGERRDDGVATDIARLSMRRVVLTLPETRALLRRLVRAGCVLSIERKGDDGKPQPTMHVLTRDGEIRLAKETRTMAALLRTSDGERYVE